MKKAIFYVFGLTITLVLFSCDAVTDNAQQQVQNTLNEVHQKVTSAITIHLNEGKKWLVNSEMKPYILKGQELTTNFVNSGKTTYAEFAKKIEASNQQLIQNCTMKGKSHDELHKWLHPHLELVQQLKNESDTAKANQLVKEIQASYQTFEQYFQ